MDLRLAVLGPDAKPGAASDGDSAGEGLIFGSSTVDQALVGEYRDTRGNK